MFGLLFLRLFFLFFFSFGMRVCGHKHEGADLEPSSVVFGDDTYVDVALTA